MSNHDDTKALVQSPPGAVAGRISGGALSVGAAAVGALAFGAFAIGALAIGSLVIRRLGVGRARFKTVVIDHLTVNRLTGLDKV
jgi:hypothetical protein